MRRQAPVAYTAVTAPDAPRTAGDPPMTDVRTETGDTLRGIAAGEPTVLEGLLGARRENLHDSGLDPRAHALVRVAALIALDAPPGSYASEVPAALDAGATPEEVLGVLIAVAPQVGMPRAVAAAHDLMAALGLAAAGP
jgi:alkylhydroperoxidase/carboxymuconolactone decarboxylase family protein YurZ